MIETDSGLALLAMERPYRARWTSDVTDGDGWLNEQPVHVRLFGQGGTGATIHRLQLTLGVAEDMTGARRFRVQDGDEVVRGGLRPGQSRTVRFEVCVPPSGHRDVTIQATGLSRLPNKQLASARLWPVDTAPTGAPCRG